GSTAFAEGLPITPGLWEIKTQNSMLDSEEVQQSCMKDAVFDPLSMMGEEEGCEIKNEVITGNSVDYDVACVDDQQAGKAEGHFSFTIDGDQGSGKIDLTMTVGDQSMNMQISMDARRIGDC
ncbi:MAG: DUF3617 domain-containing protein, partial [Geminicoccaceae bacterium]